MCSIWCPFAPIYSCSVLKKTSCKRPSTGSRSPGYFIMVLWNCFQRSYLLIPSQGKPEAKYGKQIWFHFMLLNFFQGPSADPNSHPAPSRLLCSLQPKVKGRAEKGFLFFLYIDPAIMAQKWLTNSFLSTVMVKNEKSKKVQSRSSEAGYGR